VREAATICPHPLQIDLWPFDLESGVRVTCDVGYLCVNFSFPRPVSSWLKPDIHDRQSDVRCASLLNAPTLGWGIIKNNTSWYRLSGRDFKSFKCHSRSFWSDGDVQVNSSKLLDQQRRINVLQVRGVTRESHSSHLMRISDQNATRCQR